MKRWTQWTLLAAMVVAAGCSDGARETPESPEGPEPPMLADPAGLVEFAIPEGWAERSQSNAIRFARADAPDSPTVLAVAAEPRDPSRDLAAERKLRQSQMKATGQAIRVDETFEMNGWQVWESAAARERGPVMHSFHLFSDDVAAEVWLIAGSSDYALLAEDLRAVAQSVRARQTTDGGAQP